MAPTLGLEEDEAIFLTMRSKIVRRLPSWQLSDVVSQQRLQLRRLALVNRIPKLRFDPVSFLFLSSFSFSILVLVGVYTHKIQYKWIFCTFFTTKSFLVDNFPCITG